MRTPAIPEPATTKILLVDVQEKFVPAMPESFPETAAKQKILLEGAKALGVDVVVTEQYPQGLGRSIADLSDVFASEWPIMEKTAFSALGEAAIRTELEKTPTETLVVAGIETHVCILQTVLESLERGWRTIVLADAVASRKEMDKKTALDAARSAGAWVWTVEAILFALTRDAKNAHFKTISKLVR